MVSLLLEYSLCKKQTNKHFFRRMHFRLVIRDYPYSYGSHSDTSFW